MDTPARQIDRLTHLVLDGVATDAERAQLSQLLTEHPQRISAVVDELTLDALLKWQSGSVVENAPLNGAEVVEPHLPFIRPILKSAPLWTGIIAATVLFVLGLTAWNPQATDGSDPVIADIVDQQGVAWSADSTALAGDAGVRRGRLSSTGGEYTLQFRDGSTVRVVGAASLDIKSKMLVQLDRGQATANVPEGSTGFTITSALVNVVDQGTKFGISVDDGRADVVVFDGKVDVQSNVGQSGKEKRLIQGEAIQVDSQGAIGRLADIRGDVEGRWWTGDRPGSNAKVIASVSDNIWGGTEKYECYQTTYRGLKEDSIAYTDNPHHQWNGVTTDGLPDFLRGADYIQTFNHLRYMDYFEMKVELSQPANLYVFADNRIPPPDWLVEQFEDTGAEIGLDEGPWLDSVEPQYREFDVNTTAAGAGKSIDNEFSVWRRRCAAGEVVTLGHAGDPGAEGGQGRAMYGIAATPLEDESAPASNDSERP